MSKSAKSPPPVSPTLVKSVAESVEFLGRCCMWGAIIGASMKASDLMVIGNWLVYLSERLTPTPTKER